MLKKEQDWDEAMRLQFETDDEATKALSDIRENMKFQVEEFSRNQLDQFS